MAQRHKHADLIIEWANGADIEYFDHSGKWDSIPTPSWDEDKMYRLNDPYRELKDAYLAGKVIQIKDGGEWDNIDCPLFKAPASDYRIKPEPVITTHRGSFCHRIDGEIVATYHNGVINSVKMFDD